MYFQIHWRVVVGFFLCLTICYSSVGFAIESLGFTDLKKRVEQIETQDAYNLSGSDLADRISEVTEDVEEFIRENPENVDALILSVRLGYLEEAFIKARAENTVEVMVESDSKFQELHLRLDKAIVLHPKYAAAYYWKAALFGMTTAMPDSSGGLSKRHINLEKAIQFARKAVEFDNANQWYKHTLAIYLYSSGDIKAALKVIDIPGMESYPVTRLLKDMEAFPLPFGTIFSQEDTDSYTDLMMKQKTIDNFPNLRVRVYVVPLSVEEMTSFYRTKWPSFTFFSQGSSNLYSQYMLPRGEELRPSAHIGEARAWASQKMGSIILSVQEVKNATEEQRLQSPSGHKLPANLGENFSYLFYVNNRVVK